MKRYPPKENAAREIANLITQREQTTVTPAEIETWRADEIYLWLETWGYEYKGDGDWYKIGKESKND